MAYINKPLLDSLPSANRGSVTAYLIEYNQNPKSNPKSWQFLYNPSLLSYSKEANYSDAQVLGAKKQELQYAYSSGKTLTINDIVLHSWQEGKSVQPILDGLEALLETQEGKSSPPILSFIFGSKTFAPCVLVAITYDESAWLSGAPAIVKLNLTLREIPQPLTLAELDARRNGISKAASDTKQKAGMPRKPLTDRQLKDASSLATKYLTERIKLYKPDIQSLIKSKSYKLSTAKDSGDVSLFDKNGKLLGVVFRYDGVGFKAFDNELKQKP